MQAVMTLARTWVDVLKMRNISVGMATALGAGLFVGLGLFGLWVVACVVGGMVEAGGPLGFVQSWFQAAFEG